MNNKKNYCVDCNKEISFSSTRCIICANKYRKHVPIKHCKFCNKILNRHNKVGLCQSCSCKERFKNPKKHPAYIDGRSFKKYFCKICNKEICRATFIYGQKTCISCAHKELYKDHQNHPMWLGGKSFEPYPIGWTKTFKQQIRDRDNHECQICHKSEILLDEILSVHHIDYDKENLEPENLISLCRSCHTKTNFNRNFWIDLFTMEFLLI